MFSIYQLLLVTEAKQLHENLFTAPTIICNLMPQCPKARHVFYCLQWTTGASVLHHPLQTRQVGRASASQLQQRTCPIRTCSQKVPIGGSHSIAMGCWRSTAPQHTVCQASMAASKLRTQLALLTHFQVSFDCFAAVQSLSQMASDWVWLLINMYYLGGEFAGSEYGNSVAPVCSREDNPERSPKPFKHKQFCCPSLHY